jgi:hypothetical protein
MDIVIQKSVVWFSHNENKYDAELKLFQRYFYWTRRSQIWDWDNCAVTWIKNTEKQVRIIIRSSKLVSSDYRKKPVKIKYMLGFDIEAAYIQYPITDKYPEPLDNKDKKYGLPKRRWAVKLNKHYCIWQWAEEGQNKIENSEIYKIYLGIKKHYLSLSLLKRVSLESMERLLTID